MIPKLKKRLENAERFETWEEAFDTCRERDRPIDIALPVGGGTEYAQIFPSGYVKILHETTTIHVPNDRNFHENPCDFLNG